jgi:hypothetical protein
VALTAEDHGCVADDPPPPGGENSPWANTTEKRSFVVTPAQNGSGYFVTRYDVNGAFTFDYNPDATINASSATWDDAPVQPERSVKRERRSATASSKHGRPVLAGLAWTSSDA